MGNEKNYFEVDGSVDIKGAILRALAYGQGPKNKSLIMPIEEEDVVENMPNSMLLEKPDVHMALRKMIAENEMLVTRPRPNEDRIGGELLFWIDGITPRGWEYINTQGVKP